MHVLFVAIASLIALVGSIGAGAAISRAVKRERRALPPGAGPAERPENVRRILKHLVRSSIASLVDGTAAVIHGRIAGAAGLVAPLSGRPCLGYHVWIRAAGLGVDRTLLHDRARCADFTLRDASGEIAVAGAGLELAITHAPATIYMLPFPAWLVPLLPPTLASPMVEVAEGLLMPDDEVLVCGVASRERRADDSYRDGETVTASLVATPTFPLVASTDLDLLAPGGRPIDPAELPR